MKRFLVPAIVLSIISAALLAYLVYYTAPFEGDLLDISVNHLRVVVFLITVFFLVSCLLSIVLYYIYRLLGDYMEPRFTYRKSMRQGALVGLGVVVVMVLKLTQTFNIITLLLSIGVIVSLELTLRQ